MNKPPPKRARASRPAPPVAPASGAALDPVALAQTLRQLLQPLAALAIARGVPYATMDDMLKGAFVDAARAAHPGLPAHGLVSRISTTTGINRREVTRIASTPNDTPATTRSPAARVFTTWLSEPSLQAPAGTPMALPRQGPAPSFEALAQSVTRDVHPRSLLDELCRLGLARVDDDDQVHTVHDSFVPKADTARMLRLLGSNVGDHLQAAVSNVLSESPPHLEQAIFTDELSTASLDEFQRLMRTQWKSLLEHSVPALQKLIDADRAAGRPADQRVRVGMYTYNEVVAVSPAGTATTAPVQKRKAASKRPKEQ